MGKLIRRRYILFSFSLCVCLSAFGQQERQFLLRSDEGRLDYGSLLSVGHSGEFRVYLRSNWEKRSSEATAILGSYQRRSDTLSFRPLVPFSSELDYVAVPTEGPPFFFHLPKLEQTEAPRLTAVFPPANELLPANLLKVYLFFSKPMSTVDPMRHITFEDAEGKRLDNVFLDDQLHLWNADRTRLTLWLQPGRIKRDLGPNKHLGAPLQAGQRYHLRIATDWRCTDGLRLAPSETLNSQWLIAAADREQPAPNDWRLNLPAVGTRAPFHINFGELLDPLIARRAFSFWTATGQEVEGELKVGANGRSLHFEPKQAWSAGTYRIRIARELEDLAGNNLSRLFDRDLWQKDQQFDDRPFFDRHFSL